MKPMVGSVICFPSWAGCSPVGRWVLVSMLGGGLLGCGPELGGGSTDSDGSSGRDSTTEGPGTGPVDGTSTTAETAEATTADETAETAETTTADGTTGDPPDRACSFEPGEFQCSLLAQDCPEGFRCMPWGGEILLGAAHCVPEAALPVARYGACTVDERSCSDDCELGTWCAADSLPWIDDDVCLGLCFGDADCREGELCLETLETAVGACLPGCDPLAPVCPGQTSPCVPVPTLGFACTPGATAEGDPGDPCGLDSPCAVGSMCVVDSVLGDACEADACCTALCDLVDGDPGCPGPGEICLPIPNETPPPPGQEHVGICGAA